MENCQNCGPGCENFFVIHGERKCLKNLGSAFASAGLRRGFSAANTFSSEEQFSSDDKKWEMVGRVEHMKGMVAKMQEDDSDIELSNLETMLNQVEALEKMVDQLDEFEEEVPEPSWIEEVGLSVGLIPELVKQYRRDYQQPHAEQGDLGIPTARKGIPELQKLVQNFSGSYEQVQEWFASLMHTGLT